MQPSYVVAVLVQLDVQLEQVAQAAALVQLPSRVAGAAAVAALDLALAAAMRVAAANSRSVFVEASPEDVAHQLYFGVANSLPVVGANLHSIDAEELHL